MLDKLAAWKGDFLGIEDNPDDSLAKDQFESMVENQQVVLDWDLTRQYRTGTRALGRRHSNIKINALVFTERWTILIQWWSGQPAVWLNLIQVTSMGPNTASYCNRVGARRVDWRWW